MKSLKQVVTLLFLFALLSTSLTSVRAQDDETQPLDDKFVGALVAMAVNDNMMEGENEIRDLKALHSFVSDYYDDRIAADPNSTGAQWLGLQKKLLTSKLEEEIYIKSGRDGLAAILSIFTDEEYLNITRESMGLRRFVSGDDNPPPDYFSTMNSLIMTDIELQVDLLLDIDIFTVKPSIAKQGAVSSSWSHDVPAITSSTAGLRVAGASQPGVSFAGVDSGPSSGAGVQITKPVRFDNNGFESVTVKVASYSPAAGYGAAVPSASTVVSPDSNSSAYLDLPPGDYTFCYEWQLDQDADNDGYFDYHHRQTGSVSLTASASDNPSTAVTVTLSPDSAVSNPNGKCGQTAPASAASGLTPEEAANAGSHSYLMTCPAESWCGGESLLVSLDISFSGNTISVVDKDMGGEITVLNRTGLNQYTYIDEDGESRVLTFNLQGFQYQLPDYDGWTYDYVRQDDNPAPSSSGGSPSSGSSASGASSPASANSGTHTYSYYSAEFPNEEINVSFTVTFSPGSAVIQDTNGLYWIFGENEVYLREISENNYSYAPTGGEQWGTVTFTNEGFIETWTDNGRSTYWTLLD